MIRALHNPASCGPLLGLSLLVLLTSPLAFAADPLLPKDYRLSNGLTLRVIEDRELPRVSVSLMLPAGFAQDAPERLGQASLTARLLDEGTRSHKGVELATAIEGLGSALGPSVQAEFTVFSADFLSRDLPTGLSLLAEMMVEPSFETDALERERDMLLAEVGTILSDPGPLADRLLYKALYADHPYGRPETGTEQGLTALQRQDVLSFHERWYRPEGATLAIVGDVDPSAAKKIAERAFSSWKGKRAPQALPPASAPWAGTRLLLVDMPGQTQAQIRVAARSVPRGHADWIPLRVANGLLGSGFTSYLVEEIRVNRSLSYGAGSDLSSFRDESVFSVSTFTRNETVRETLDVATQVLDQWRAGPWEPESFQRAHQLYQGLLPQILETPPSRAWQLLLMSYYGSPAEWMSRMGPSAAAVSQLQAQEAARRHIPQEGRLVLILGDASVIRPQLESYGKGEWTSLKPE